MSHLYVLRRAAKLAGGEAAARRLVSCHLGAGSAGHRRGEGGGA
ncbi:MAG: hypothetical protein FJX73_12420 [Armatimonadetes bacterium]|nr:hypothetical protein [Armatimonadota bacterium]